MEWEAESIIINLSSKSIPPAALSALNYGLGFVPTPSYNPFHTRVDLFRLFRNIKLKKFFGQTTSIDTCPFKRKSTFVPNVIDPSISVFEKLVLRDVADLEKTRYKVKNNLTKDQLSSLYNLASDKSLTLKSADKGGGIVLLDSDMYIQEAYRQLNDPSSYSRIKEDPTKSIMSIIRVTLQEVLSLDYIDKNLADFLTVDFPRVPRFYLLPKIHKPGFPPRGRLIAAAQGSLLENISKYLDHLLQPPVLKMKTYICDTGHFISKIEGLTIPKHSVILSFDVVSLYTCIPYDDIRSVVRHYLEPEREHLPPIHFLLDLVDILLEKNYLTFNDEFFLQTRGVSMGSAFAPSIANLFMAWLPL